MGFRLVEREYLCEQGKWVLRLYIDRLDEQEEPVNIDDCANVSRSIQDLIEVEGIIEQNYLLEVSSPGLNRPLRYAEDFQRYVGSNVKLKTLHQIDGRGNFKGVLASFENNIITIIIDGEHYKIPYQELAKANVQAELKIGSKVKH
jgi:ribosome maturation factor RimP